MKLSIVTTLYRSAPYVAEFHARITAAAVQITDDYEIIMVDDGSPDDSLQKSLAIQAVDPHVTVVELSRNFGHHKAIVAGLAQARGERIFLLDVDLEEQPEWLPDFWQEMEGRGSDVVFGVQRERRGSPFRRWSGSLFYRLFNAVSETKIPENVCTIRLMTKPYVDALLQMRDQNLFLAGNLAWVGFHQRTLAVEKCIRGESSYSLTKRLRLFWDGVTSFSSHPLQLVFAVGLAISGGSALFGSYLFLRKLFAPETTLSGYTSIILSVWFLGGLNILFIGVVGYYVAGIFNEAKKRPQYIVRQVHRQAVTESSLAGLKARLL